MISIDTDNWELKHWLWALLVVAAILFTVAGLAGGLGYMLRGTEVQEWRGKYESTNETRVKQDQLALAKAQQDWEAQRQRESKELEERQAKLRADEEQNAKELNLGRMNEKEIDRIRSESDARLSLALWLLFLAMPLAGSVAGVLLYSWHRSLRHQREEQAIQDSARLDQDRAGIEKDRQQLREDRAAWEESRKESHSQQIELLEQAQRAHLALGFAEQLKGDPVALERALSAMFAPRLGRKEEPDSAAGDEGQPAAA